MAKNNSSGKIIPFQGEEITEAQRAKFKKAKKQGAEELRKTSSAGERNTLKPAARPGKRPVISIRAGQIPRMKRELMQALQGHLYQREGYLAFPVRLPESALIKNLSRRLPKHCTLDPGLLTIRTPDLDELLNLANQNAAWTRYNERQKCDVEANAPMEVVRMLRASVGEWPFPVLSGVVSSPIMRYDGSILATPGYDADTGLYADFNPDDFPPVPDNPTRADAETALTYLRDIIAEFPFRTPLDESVAIANMLTAVSRMAYLNAPMFAYSSPTKGTGKSTLADLMSVMAHGEPAAAINYTENEEEFYKAFTAMLMLGVPAIMLDNVTGEVNQPVLNTALTQYSLLARILGKSQMVRVFTQVMIIVNGNNLTIANDLIRRTLFCTLDAQMENPAGRKFKNPDFHAFALQNRGKMISSALTILRSFIACKPAPVADLTPFGSFLEWSTFVREPLILLNLPDPLESQYVMEEIDPQRNRFNLFLTTMRNNYENREFTAGEIMEKCLKNDKLYRTLLEATASRGNLSAVSIGRFLSRNDGKIVNNLKLIRTSNAHGSVHWQVMEI